jgi:hypothetical protein
MDWGTTSPKITSRVSKVEMVGSAHKHTNEYGGAENSRPTPAERPVEHDGEGLVGNDVAQEQCNQNPVLALLEEFEDLGGILALGALARRSEDLKVDLVLSHQSVREPY